MNAQVQFDSELLRRYDQTGPRYTSYPTAPQFRNDFSAQNFVEAAKSSNELPIPAPLSLYVHIPFCLSPCFYCGCNRVITRDLARAEKYLSPLKREFALVAPLIDDDREVVQLHIGGGTPNFLSPAQIGDLIAALKQNFRFSQSEKRDFSIELDPRSVTPNNIKELAVIGFNRASFGVQDFDPIVQAAVNRIQSVEQTIAVIDACRTHQFRSVNVDLIYGLPKQNIIGFGKTLDTVIAARPDRLAVYSYAHLPNQFKGQNQIEVSDLPSAEIKLALLQLAIKKLLEAGYCYIGMDHFALPEDELAIAQANGDLHRNFMGYSTFARTDLIGFGVSAISHLGDSFSQNLRDVPSWENALQQSQLPIWRGLQLNQDDIIRAEVIQNLMCNFCLDKSQIEQTYGIKFEHYFEVDLIRLKPLIADGLVQDSSTKIEVTMRGRMLVRTIAACFDFYLHRKLEKNLSSNVASFTSAAPTYSKMI